MATWTWAGGSADRPSMSWCRSRTSICCASRTKLRRWRKYAISPASPTFCRPVTTAAFRPASRPVPRCSLRAPARSGWRRQPPRCCSAQRWLWVWASTRKASHKRAHSVARQLNLGKAADRIERIRGVREVDCAVDGVGCEAKGHGGADQPAVVLNQLMDVTRAAGAIGIPGLYVTDDPGAKDDAARTGNLGLRFGLGWAKSLSFATGQTPVMKYNRALMMAVLHDRIRIAKAVNATVDRK